MDAININHTCCNGSTFVGIREETDLGEKFIGKLTWQHNERVFEGEVFPSFEPKDGIMTQPNGNIFEGVFPEDIWTGYSKGTIRYNNGDVFIGKIYPSYNDGIMTFANGDIFIGKLMNSIPCEGTITHSVQKKVIISNGKE